jgi:hypothetical protein
MPKVTIWIRNEDYDKWKAIQDKPEWLHEHLNLKPGLQTVYALEDIKKGQAGLGFLTKPKQDIPIYPQDDPHPEPKLTPPEETL